MRSAGEKAFIRSYQKIFTVEPQVNVQNGGILAASSASVVPLVKTILPRQEHTEIRLWTAVASVYSKFRLVLLEKGVKVNIQVYLKMPNEHVPYCIAELIKKGT